MVRNPKTIQWKKDNPCPYREGDAVRIKDTDTTAKVVKVYLRHLKWFVYLDTMPVYRSFFLEELEPAHKDRTTTVVNTQPTPANAPPVRTMSIRRPPRRSKFLLTFTVQDESGTEAYNLFDVVFPSFIVQKVLGASENYVLYIHNESEYSTCSCEYGKHRKDPAKKHCRHVAAVLKILQMEADETTVI